jgi:hypothetical protein
VREKNTIELGKVKANGCLWPRVWGWLDLDQKQPKKLNCKARRRKASCMLKKQTNHKTEDKKLPDDNYGSGGAEIGKTCLGCYQMWSPAE